MCKNCVYEGNDHPVEIIREEIRNTQNHLWYYPRNGQLIQAVCATTKKESIKLMKAKIKNTGNRFLNTDIIYGCIENHDRVSKCAKSTIYIKIRVKRINDKGQIRNNHELMNYGKIWLTDSYLEEKGFRDGYIYTCARIIYYESNKISALGKYTFSGLCKYQTINNKYIKGY